MRSASKSLAASRSTAAGSPAMACTTTLARARLLGDHPAPLGQLLGLDPVGEGEADVVGHLVDVRRSVPAPPGCVGGDDDDPGAVGRGQLGGLGDGPLGGGRAVGAHHDARVAPSGPAILAASSAAPRRGTLADDRRNRPRTASRVARAPAVFPPARCAAATARWASTQVRALSQEPLQGVGGEALGPLDVSPASAARIADQATARRQMLVRTSPAASVMASSSRSAASGRRPGRGPAWRARRGRGSRCPGRRRRCGRGPGWRGPRGRPPRRRRHRGGWRPAPPAAGPRCPRR